MKLNLLLLLTLPCAIYAQEVIEVSNTQDTLSIAERYKTEYPNTYSSGSSDVEDFDNKHRRFNDWAISVGGGGAFMSQADLTSFFGGDVDWGWNIYASLDKQITHAFGISLQYQTGQTNQRGQLPGNEGQLAGVANAWTKFNQVSLIGDINFSNLFRRVDNKSPYRWALHGYAGIGFQGYKTELIDKNASRWSTNPPRVPIMVDQKLGIASFFYQGGLGVKFKVNKLIDLEARSMYIISGDEEFDGGLEVRGNQNSPANKAVAYNLINDSYSDDMFTVNLGMSFKLGKHETHLAWYDPLQNIYYRLGELGNRDYDLVVCESGDNDNDGVCDDWDRQLDTPEGARVDGSGVALDVDLDSVIDLYDKCVTVPGTVENNGCPEVAEIPVATVEDINKDFEGIEFALNSDVIRPQSFDKLNHAAEIIKALEGFDTFTVVGATDTRGSDAYNQRLSQKRAEAVVRYLESKGVEKNMLKAEGRGEKDLKYPECDPATKCPEWKNEANRRVFFEAH